MRMCKRTVDPPSSSTNGTISTRHGLIAIRSEPKPQPIPLCLEIGNAQENCDVRPKRANAPPRAPGRPSRLGLPFYPKPGIHQNRWLMRCVTPSTVQQNLQQLETNAVSAHIPSRPCRRNRSRGTRHHRYDANCANVVCTTRANTTRTLKTQNGLRLQMLTNQ